MQFLMWVWELCVMLQLPYGAKVLNLSVFCIKSQLKNPICCLIWLLQRQCCFSNQFSNNITFVMGGIQFASEITGKKVCRNLIPVLFALSAPGCGEKGAQSRQCGHCTLSLNQPCREPCTKKSSRTLCFDTKWVPSPEQTMMQSSDLVAVSFGVQFQDIC